VSSVKISIDPYMVIITCTGLFVLQWEVEEERERGGVERGRKGEIAVRGVPLLKM